MDRALKVSKVQVDGAFSLESRTTYDVLCARNEGDDYGVLR